MPTIITSGGGASVVNPPGTVLLYGGAGEPAGYLLCDGQAVSRVTFASLFAIIGTQYGIGDGATTFNVPDMRTGNQFPRGATNDAGRGNTGGAATHLLTGPESGVQAHSHSYIPIGNTANGIAGNNTANIQGVPIQTGTTGPVNATGAHNNEPQFVDFNYIIKV